MGKEEVTYIPETAHEWLEVWDSGEPVASVEMGGLGEHYEQAIQVTAAEALRELLHLDPESGELPLEAWWKRCCGNSGCPVPVGWPVDPCHPGRSRARLRGSVPSRLRKVA